MRAYFLSCLIMNSSPGNANALAAGTVGLFSAVAVEPRSKVEMELLAAVRARNYGHDGAAASLCGVQAFPGILRMDYLSAYAYYAYA